MTNEQAKLLAIARDKHAKAHGNTMNALGNEARWQAVLDVAVCERAACAREEYRLAQELAALEQECAV